VKLEGEKGKLKIDIKNEVLGVRVMVFSTTFNNISVTRYIVEVSFLIGGGNRKKTLTCRKSLTNFIT
jgi:hypothetical protein